MFAGAWHSQINRLMPCEGNGSLSGGRLLGIHKAVCDIETEKQLNPVDLGAKPASCNFASVVEIF